MKNKVKGEFALERFRINLILMATAQWLVKNKFILFWNNSKYKIENKVKLDSKIRQQCCLAGNITEEIIQLRFVVLFIYFLFTKLSISVVEYGGYHKLTSAVSSLIEEWVTLPQNMIHWLTLPRVEISCTCHLSFNIFFYGICTYLLEIQHLSLFAYNSHIITSPPPPPEVSQQTLQTLQSISFA